MDVALQAPLYLTTGVDVVHIGVDDDLKEHLRIIRTAATLLVELAETTQIKALYNAADKADGILFRNILSILCGKSTIWFGEYGQKWYICITFEFCRKGTTFLRHNKALA